MSNSTAGTEKAWAGWQKNAGCGHASSRRRWERWREREDMWERMGWLGGGSRSNGEGMKTGGERKPRGKSGGGWTGGGKKQSPGA